MNRKKYSYVGMSLIILVFGIWAIPKIVDRFQENDIVQGYPSEGGANPDKNGKAVGFLEINGKKQKAPAFEFVDQHGETITNKDYEGKVYVVEFFFTTCPTICPVMNANLKEVEKEFKGNDDFGIASFSIDSQNDTPEVLKAYAEEHNITSPNWHLMTGDQQHIFKLANKGFKINAEKSPNAQGGFLHSGMFALVDKNGYLRSRKDKYGNPLIYYRGYLEMNAKVDVQDEEPQIKIMIADIKKLL